MALAYVLNNGKLGKFLDEIQGAPVPTQVDTKYLASRGYTGKNDAYLPSFLDKLGFTDNGGKPTDRWRDHRHSAQAMQQRADGVRQAYSGFFDLYPDADKRTEQEFTNWARSEDPKASPTTIKRAWATFKTMVTLSDFSGGGTATPSGAGTTTPPPTSSASPPTHTPSPAVTPAVHLGAVGGITINIELQIPATADTKFFDQFFSSMRKHLIDDDA